MLVLPATLTAREANDTRRLLLQALGALVDRNEVVVDASNLKRFDSAALAVLLECERAAQAAGKPFHVRQWPDHLLALAHLYGVDALLSANAPAGAPAGPTAPQLPAVSQTA